MSEGTPDYPRECFWNDHCRKVCRLRQLTRTNPNEVERIQLGNTVAQADTEQCPCLPRYRLPQMRAGTVNPRRRVVLRKKNKKS